MEALRRHVQLVNPGDGRWLAFDASGGLVVDPSKRLPRWFDLPRFDAAIGSSPLDVFDRSSHGAAVAAFERARRTGHGSANALLADGERRDIHIFDLTAAADCFLGIVTSVGDATATARPASRFRARQGSLGISASGVIEWVSPDFTSMLGWSEPELVGTSSLEIIHEHDHESGIVGWIEVLEQHGHSVTLRQRFKAVDGEWRWCEVTDRNLLDDPSWNCVRADLVDISRELDAYAELQRREALLDRLSRSLPTAVLYVDVDGNPLVSNTKWDELTGRSSAEGLEGLRDVVTDPDGLDEAVAAAMHVDVDIEVQFKKVAAGVCRYGDLHLRPLSERGRPLGLLVTLDDRTLVRLHQAELADQARRDTLTGLANRRGMEEMVRERLDRGGSRLVLAFLDLDRFKTINDTAGHTAGDAFLKATAVRLPTLLRGGDVIARIGGDEFVAILTADDAEDVAERFASEAERAITEIAREFHPELDVGVSVGIAVAQPDDSLDNLLRRADAAMYERKAAGRVTSGAGHRA